MKDNYPQVAQLVEPGPDSASVGGSTPSLRTIRTTKQLVVDQMLKDITFRPYTTVLEPSAGSGDLVDCLKNRKIFRFIALDCVELNQDRFNKLKEKGYVAYHADFLLWDTTTKYDHVIAAPTFVDNVDCDHVIKMYTHVKPTGMVISLMSPEWMRGKKERQLCFRKWLEDKRYAITVLKDNSYMENGETVPTIVIKLFGENFGRY